MISIINRQRHERISAPSVRRIAAQALTDALPETLQRTDFDINVIFVGDGAIRRLNREYRNIDRPTDVLSFPYLDLPSPYADTPSPTADLAADDPLLGEVVISTQTARRYGQELGLTFPVEIKTLVIHGVLHLCGYDHEVDDGEMTRLERKLRKRLIGDHSDW
jgi:probable rRNA maturation factor